MCGVRTPARWIYEYAENAEVTAGDGGLSWGAGRRRGAKHSCADAWRFAWRVPKLKQTVVRAGFGMNYTVGEYATFATEMAHQPPFTNEQTNQEANREQRFVGTAR